MIFPILVLFATGFVVVKFLPNPSLKVYKDFYFISRNSYSYRFIGINDQQMAQALVELGHTSEFLQDGKFARISG